MRLVLLWMPITQYLGPFYASSWVFSLIDIEWDSPCEIQTRKTFFRCTCTQEEIFKKNSNFLKCSLPFYRWCFSVQRWKPNKLRNLAFATCITCHRLISVLSNNVDMWRVFQKLGNKPFFHESTATAHQTECYGTICFQRMRALHPHRNSCLAMIL